MNLAKRALGLAFVTALGVGACSTTTTTSTAAGGGTSTAAPGTTSAPGTTTAAGTAASPTGAVELKVITTPFGKAIGRGDGKVVYAWDKEADGTVQCVDTECIEKWPPVLAGSFTATDGLDAASFALIDRPDGTKQVALKGRPLYTMALDKPGQANCQGGDGWWIQNPDGTKNTSTDLVK